MARSVRPCLRMFVECRNDEGPPETWCKNCRPRSTDHRTLDAILDNIAMFARRALAFGHQATPQTPARMIQRRDEALQQIVALAESGGARPSTVLRSAAASALRSIPSEARAEASRENGKKGGRPASPNTHKRKAKATK
jgi:hypothetical protein